MKTDDLYKRKGELLEFGFEQETDRTLRYYIYKDKSQEIYMDICLSNTDVYPCLTVYSFEEFEECDTNENYLPMLNINTVELVKKSIEDLKMMFTV